MWSRRRLLSDICLERNKPTCWSRSPIKLRAQYEHVYLTTPKETFGGITERIANAHSSGENKNSVVTLTITEPMPSMKRLTEALEEHWKGMLHAAIAEAAQQKPLLYFDKAIEEATMSDCGIPPTGRFKLSATT